MAHWVYKQTEARLWTVGYYDPAGVFYPVEDTSTPDEAAERVHWLNGGKTNEDDNAGTRSNTLRVCLTEAERASLEEAAERAGQSMSEYARRRIFE